MEFPPEVHEAARIAVHEFPTDVAAAVRCAERAVRRLPAFPALVDALITHAIQELVYRERNYCNQRLKGDNAGPQKVDRLASAELARVCESVYCHKIGGTQLGDLTGERLPDLIDAEDSKAKAHLFNRKLLEWVRQQGVAEGQKVRDAIPEEKLTKAYRRILRETLGG